MSSPNVFVPNPDFADEYESSDDAVEMLRPLAAKGAEVARQVAPARLRHYRGSIDSVAGIADDGKAVGRIFATDFKAVWIEMGTGAPFPTPAFAPLRTGADKAVRA